MDDFLRWLGEQVGAALRFVVDLLAGTFTGLDDFFAGLTRSLGMGVSVSGLILLALGIYLLYSGFRCLFRKALFGSVVRLGLAVLLLGWLIN